MTKQEEIKGTIKRNFGCPYIKDSQLAKQNCDTHIDCDECVADWLLKILSDKGVVIKVDGEKGTVQVPSEGFGFQVETTIPISIQSLEQVGYVAFESLVKEN